MNPENESGEKNINQQKKVIVTPFSQDDLNRAWTKYAKTLYEKIHLKNTMLNILPILKDNYAIEVIVYNPPQEEALKEEATPLVEYLRKELQNTSIIMQVSIGEADPKKIIFSDKEKFELMLSTNKDIMKLVEEFNLKFD